jgi:protein-S-isoprenylcysteine O-methyltransferase Ste14
MATATFPLFAGARSRITEGLPDFSARIGVGGLFLVLAWQLGNDFVRTGRPTDLLLLVGESLVVILTCFRRRANVVNRGAIARIVTTVSMVAPLLVRPVAGAGVISETIAAMIGGIGLLIVIGGKISLGYSFGLLPANRGVINRGLYRIVRHPIYLGYLITHLPFLAAHPSLWNIALLVIGDSTLIVRAFYEEQTLSLDPKYRRYRQDVKWRLLPGVV